MSININAKNDYSYLFSNQSSSSSSALSDLSWLSEYASIKSGAYGKLMKAYYSSDASEEVSKVASKNNDLSTTSEDTKAYNKVATTADSLQKSIEQVGKIGSKGDLEELSTAVNNFVKDYNSLLEATKKVSDTNISNRVNTIENYTKSNNKELAKLGISVEGDGSLKLDKDTFDKADKSGLDNLFASKGSYGYAVSVSAGMAQSSASYDASRESTYTSSGTYSSVTGSLWDSIT